MRVTQAAADPESSINDIAKIIQQDAGLSAQVLRSVNTSFYSPRAKITSPVRAVGYMGIHAVRNLVLCLAARKRFEIKADFPIQEFWLASLSRAAAAQRLAEKMGIPGPSELFTLGLCQDLGVLVLVQERPELGPELAQAIRHPADLRLVQEQKLAQGHDELGYRMFTEWQLPEQLTEPIRYHHRPERAPEASRVHARIARAAEAIADLLVVEDKQTAMKDAEKQLEALGQPAEVLPGLVEQTSELVDSAAEVLDVKVGKQPTYDEIQDLATKGLLSLSMSYQELTDHLKDSLDKQQRMANELKVLNKELETRANTDGLTGLPNRRAFDEMLTREISQAKRQDKPLSVMLMDVDHFKRFNDTYGHQAGDLVLQQVAAAIRSTVRKADFPARYGGEEFVVIMPFTPPGGAKIAAERARAAVEATTVEWEGEELHVTISIGCSTLDDPTHKRAAVKVLRNADDALYDAKDSGRNKVCMNGA
jgi:diguanylate cyclase (GGDEF)-like protein